MAVTDQITPAQRRRSLAIAWGLAALVVLFFVVTMVRLQGNVAKRMEQKDGAATSVTVPKQTETNGGQ